MGKTASLAQTDFHQKQPEHALDDDPPHPEIGSTAITDEHKREQQKIRPQQNFANGDQRIACPKASRKLYLFDAVKLYACQSIFWMLYRQSREA